MSSRKRVEIENLDARSLKDFKPTAKVGGISGVRVYDVGQGDGLCVLDDEGKPFLQVDYGGWYKHPFSDTHDIQTRMPLSGIKLMMLSHWDKDHWCTAERNPDAETTPWLTPRQITSPTAVAFAADRKNIRCIPEKLVAQPLEFACKNGDRIVFEKIARMPPASGPEEDCNRTGVAFSILKNKGRYEEAILLPGDAHFRHIAHYHRLKSANVRLRGMVAFHHGSGVGWKAGDYNFLSGWKPSRRGIEVAFSYGEENSYEHPDLDNYQAILPNGWKQIHTPTVRLAGDYSQDILF